MEAWFMITVSLCFAALLKHILTLLSPRSSNLPPGPPVIPFLGNPIWLRKPVSELEQVLRRLNPRYGPIITLKIAHRSFVFVSRHSIAHQALVQNGAVFADRPAAPPTVTYFNAPWKSVNGLSYGPTWRLLRRNMTQEILHPSRVRAYAASRRRVLSILMDRIRSAAESSESSSVRLIDHIRYGMICLLALMCFGDNLQESQIEQIATNQRKLLFSFRRFNVLNFWPRLGKIIYRRRWAELIELHHEQDRTLIPLIRARSQSNKSETNHEESVAYVDTLVDLILPEENRKLQEEEIVSLCSEFLTAGTDTTSTALQWIMANLVKYPKIQERVYEEIIGVVQGRVEVEEEDLSKMTYLKAVVLEALRRHPPGHFVLPHKVNEEVELEGYKIPKDADVNFMVADMHWDAEVWEEPMKFEPERFVAACEGRGGFDVTCRREIKMMPFGAGRRVCPGYALALLHLEYFVANFIRSFKWEPMLGDDVDLTEKQEFTMVMQNPLQARITPRTSSTILTLF